MIALSAISKDLLLRFVAEGATKGIGLLTMPLLVHFLGTSGYGHYSFAQAAIGALIPVVSLGLGFSLVRQIIGTSSPSLVTARLSGAFILASMAAMPCALLVWHSSPLLARWLGDAREIEMIAKMSAILLIAATWQNLAIEALRAKQRVTYITALQITEAILFPVAIIAMATANMLEAAGVIAALAALKIGVVLVIFGSAAATLRRNMSAVWMLSVDEMRMALVLGLPFMISGLGEWLMALGDRVAVGTTLGPEALGSYAAMQVLVAIMASWGAPFWWLLFPKFCNALETGGRSSAAETSRQLGALFFQWGLPIAVAIILLGTGILGLIGKSTLVVDRATLGFLVAATLVNQAATPWEYALYAERRGQVLMKATLLWGGVTITLVYLALPFLGLAGAALATLAGRIGFAANIVLKTRALGYREFLLMPPRLAGPTIAAFFAGCVAAKLIIDYSGSFGNINDDLIAAILASAGFTLVYGAILFILGRTRNNRNPSGNG
jgi:O-antigen/teichoic acid export membrane protein